MLEVKLKRDEVEGGGFVKIGSVAGAIARANRTSNSAQAERKLFWRVNAGVQLGLLNPLDPATLEPLSRKDYGMGVVAFTELVEWGHATKLFNFKSEFISPAAVRWVRAAPSMRDMVAAAQAKAVPVVRQEPEAAPVVTPEPPAAPALTESASGGVEADKSGPKVGESSADAPKRETRQSASSPKFSMRLDALIEAHKHEWPSIRTDIKAASDNGLSAAKAGARGWWEELTMEWARANGKLKSAAKPADSLAQAMHNMGSLPSRKNRLEG